MQTMNQFILDLPHVYSDRLITDDKIDLGQVSLFNHFTCYFVIFTALFRFAIAMLTSLECGDLFWSSLSMLDTKTTDQASAGVQVHVFFFHKSTAKERRTIRELFLELFSSCSLSAHICLVYRFIPCFCFRSDCSSVFLICSLHSHIVLFGRDRRQICISLIRSFFQFQ